MTIELTPPEPLTPPQPVAPVKKEEANGMVKLDEATVQKLDSRVIEFVDIVTSSEINSEAFEGKVQAIHNLGTQEIREAANVSNRLLEGPVNALSEESPVSQALLELRRTVTDLDPAQQEESKRKILGIIPWGSQVNNYFQKYQSSQKQIDAILNALYHGQDTLRKDNAAIEQEKANMWDIMQRLQQYVYVCQQLDTGLGTRIAEIETQNPEKARIVKEDMLFYIRQKQQDLLTQLAVSIQGYLALDMVRKNNLELIKGVDRATTTTVSALRTAIIVAQALTNQKMVLDQVTALNTTTSNIIESTSVMLKNQSGEIHRQATTSTVNMEQLQVAFNNVFESMDMISEFKLQALDNMAQTVNVLTTEVQKAKTYLDRERGATAIEATENLALSVDSDGKISVGEDNAEGVVTF